jgi:mono/diheme cytochrome c family protein
MKNHFYSLMGALSLAGGMLMAQSIPKESYDFDFIGQPLANPALQHAKETYVLFGCAYCHGLNLESRGEATDLMHSRLVGRDTDGKIIVALLKAGIPQTAKLSPMPQFSDLSDQQLNAIATWIHYARAQGRFKELTEAENPPPGNTDVGKAFFRDECASCHSPGGDLSGIGKKYSGSALKVALLKPKMMDDSPSFAVNQLHDQKMQAARLQHRILLENLSADEASNLTAYLASLQ